MSEKIELAVRKRAYSVKDICAIIPLSAFYVRQAIKDGDLKSSRFGRRVLVTDEALSEFLEKGLHSKPRTERN